MSWTQSSNQMVSVYRNLCAAVNWFRLSTKNTGSSCACIHQQYNYRSYDAFLLPPTCITLHCTLQWPKVRMHSLWLSFWHHWCTWLMTKYTLNYAKLSWERIRPLLYIHYFTALSLTRFGFSDNMVHILSGCILILAVGHLHNSREKFNAFVYTWNWTQCIRNRVQALWF